MDGLLAYNASLLPMLIVTKILNDNFNKQKLPPTQKVMYSMFSGAVAGAVGNIPEGIAQTQQLATRKINALTVFKHIVKNNKNFNKGAFATMSRQAFYSGGYLQMMPRIATIIEQKTQAKLFANIGSAVITGGVIGVVTTPFSNLRFHKQSHLIDQKKTLSYKEIFKKYRLMAGMKPRIPSSIISMFVLDQAKSLFDDLQEKSAPKQL